MLCGPDVVWVTMVADGVPEVEVLVVGLLGPCPQLRKRDRRSPQADHTLSILSLSIRHLSGMWRKPQRHMREWEKAAPQHRTWANRQNCNRHEEAVWETQEPRTGAGGPASRGRIRPSFPESKGFSHVEGRKGIPQDGKCRFLHICCCKFPTSLRQIIELRMCTLSNYIRERHNWWEEAKNKGVVEQWRRDILRQQEASNESPSNRLTPAMVGPCYHWTIPPSHFGVQVNYVLEELQGYASLRDPVTGIEVRLADHTDIVHTS